MGKLLGAHDSDELDRPDLNKCPDCLCFFAGDNCPLCGKECPEEMRAGNRAKVKPTKKRRNPNSGRVTFIPWYHSWLFIILMMFVMPIVGIILLCTSPHRLRTKIIVVASIVAGILIFTLVIVPLALDAQVFLLALGLSWLDDMPPVDSSITKDEYMSKCYEPDIEDFYRNPGDYDGEYVKISVVVKETLGDYYLCMADGKYEILICDYSLDGDKNFLVGDKITVYGESRGNLSFSDDNDKLYKMPCIFGAYIFFEK